MILTTADHDCLQARLAVRSSCHCCVWRWIDNLLERSLERFPNVSSLKDKQKEAVRHLLCSKDVEFYRLVPDVMTKQMQEDGNVVVLVVAVLQSKEINLLA